MRALHDRWHMLFSSLFVLATALPTVAQQEPVFSGPQKGEPLADFPLLGVFDAEAGKQFQYWDKAGEKPTFLIFVHELTRPSIAVTRTLMTYAGKHQDKLYSSIVFLGDDPTALEENLKRARHAMPANVPVYIAAGGQEGPGAYGLNRNVTLTILISKDRKAIANFAARATGGVQVDVPKVLKEIVPIVGGATPSLADLGITRQMAGSDPQRSGQVDMRALLGPVIRKTASAEQVEEAAKKAEAVFAKNPAVAQEVGTIARHIIDAGKLEDYGTAPARTYLQKWAKQYPARASEGTKKRAKQQQERAKK